ncbi:MAG: anthranilate phosphoribosyltransferase [Alphaproteobacteria bacterium]|nr:anthranilate phosphoribosyltransferase [Alphaproteobacteria bacterium]
MTDFRAIVTAAREPLSEDQMIEAMNAIMSGQAADDDIATFLTTLAERGESVDEITGAARVMRQKALSITAPEDAIDCCGTGGDASGTYNISTAVALLTAACGIPVAKHGNRAASSKSGTADVLEALGVRLEVPAPALEEALRRFHFAFLMAPRHHEAMKYVAPIRKKLGKRTIFNLLGPLANPAGTRLQLVGVFDKRWTRPMAETLHRLGTKRAWVVHGADGLDEITVTGLTYASILYDDGHIEDQTLSPEDFGLPVSPPEALKGGTPEDNASALRALLEEQKGAYRDIVLANTAAALCIHDPAQTLKEAVRVAASTLDSGKALETLQTYAAFSQEYTAL